MGLCSLRQRCPACFPLRRCWIPRAGEHGRGSRGNPPEELCEEQELHETLKQGISSLREKEQLVLSLYYEKELSMKEIAQVLNVSAPRISQIHSRAIEHLRQYMKQYMEAQ